MFERETLFTETETLGLAAPSNGAQALTPLLPVTMGCFEEVPALQLLGSSYFSRKTKGSAEESKGMLAVWLLPQCHIPSPGMLPCKICFPRPRVG